MVPAAAGAHTRVMWTTAFRDSVDAWRTAAPWAAWDRRRATAAWAMVGVPVGVGAMAFGAAFFVSLCTLGGLTCSSTQNHEIAVYGVILLVCVGLLLVASVTMFALRRRPLWLTPVALVAVVLVNYMAR